MALLKRKKNIKGDKKHGLNPAAYQGAAQMFESEKQVLCNSFF